jgi:hypothetical protein
MVSDICVRLAGHWMSLRATQIYAIVLVRINAALCCVYRSARMIFELSGLFLVAKEGIQRKAERQSCTHFVDWMTVRESMTQPDIETEVVANLPNETDQTGYCFGFAKFVLVKKLGDRSD